MFTYTRKLIAHTRDAWRRHTHMKVCIQWEEFTYTHWAYTRAEAIDWVCMYPPDASAVCMYRDRLIFARA